MSDEPKIEGQTPKPGTSAFEKFGLTFAYITAADLPEIVRMLAKESVCEYVFFGPNTEQETRAYFEPLVESIQTALAEKKRPAEHVFTIRKDGEFLGQCALLPVAFSPGNFLIGFTIDDTHWRKGIGENACRFLIDFAFQVLVARRISGDCMQGNTGSRKVMEKCGFKFEGTQKKYWNKNGRIYDNRLFGLLKEQATFEENAQEDGQEGCQAENAMTEIRDIIAHHDADPDENPRVHDSPPMEEIIEVVPCDPAWPALYEKLADDIRNVLGTTVLYLEHVGSTAVPGLAAKPVIDIDLTVADPTDEASYVPALEKLGYDLTIREPNWHQHRCLRLPSPRVSLHVFGPDCPEVIRHRLFRDWLREHPEDCALYEKTKFEAIPGAEHVMEYNERKQAVIREIYEKAFKAAGYLP